MRILWTGVAALALTMPAAAQSLGDQVQQQMPSLMTIYKDLHANPELSFMEVRSAGILATEARKLGFDVTEKVGGTGVVAVMKNGPGPVVLVRADMDGLPVTEQTGLPGASKVRVTTKEGVETGVMHACGHDTHMTSWIGTARLMAANKDKWSGTLVMIGQPAEERGAGARMMLEDGLYTRFPKPQYALAFHDAAQFPAGAIGYTPGYALANVDSVDILVKGSAVMAPIRRQPRIRSCWRAGSSPRCKRSCRVKSARSTARSSPSVVSMPARSIISSPTRRDCS